MQENSQSGRNGYIEIEGRRIVFSRNDFSFQFLCEKVGFEAAKCTVPLKNIEQYVFGKTQDDCEIAIFTGPLDRFHTSPFSINTSFYMIGHNNVAYTDIKKYVAIEFIGGSLDLLYKYGEISTKCSDDRWLITIDTHTIESSFEYKGKKCKITVAYAPRDDASIKFATHLRIEFPEEQEVSNLQTYIRWANKLASFLLDRENVGFDRIITYSNGGLFGNGWYSVAECFIRNSYLNGLTTRKFGISFEQVGARIGELMRIIANSDSQEQQFTLNFHPASDSETNFVSTDQLRSICSAVEHEIEVYSELNAEEDARITRLIEEIKVIIHKHRDSELRLQKGTYDLICSDMKHWTAPLQLKIVKLAEKFDHILLNCRDVDSNSYSDKRISEFVKYRNKISHGSYFQMTQNVAETAIAIESLVYVCILHRIGMTDIELLEISRWGIGR